MPSRFRALPALALAALVGALPTRAAAQPFKETGDDSVPGSAAGSDPQAKAVVLAAIHEFTGPSRAIATQHFAQVFPTMPVQGGEPAAFNEGYIAAAGDLLEKMVLAGKITVTRVAGSDFSADWTPFLKGQGMTGGAMRVGGLEKAAAAGSGANSCQDLFKQDQFANTVLHETAHMFYSVLQYAFQAQTTMTSPSMRTEFVQTNYWRGNPQGFCHSERECGLCGIDPMTHRYKWTFQGAHRKGSATEWAAREIPWRMCLAGSCQADARVLAPLFR